MPSKGGIFDKNWVPLLPPLGRFTPPLLRPAEEDYGFPRCRAPEPAPPCIPEKPPTSFEASPMHIKSLFGPAPEIASPEFNPAFSSLLTQTTKVTISPEAQRKPIIHEFTKFEYAAMGLVAGIWTGADFIYRGVKSTLCYAGLVAASTISGGRRIMGVGRVVKPKSKRASRHDPLSRAKRPRTPKKDGGKGQSMLDLPPHYAGATPHRMRNTRVEPKNKATLPASSPMETPQPKKQEPKLAGTTKKVRFAEEGPSTPENTSGPYAGLDTPALVRETPAALRKPLNVRDEFQKNFKKKEFAPWVEFLHSQGIKMREFRVDLHETLSLPTDIILRLYDDRESNPVHWDTLIMALGHNGFLDKMRVVVPKYRYGPPPISWQEAREKNPVKVISDSPYQQQDGCCRFCRGFSWAGKIETREIARFGDEVECKSQHKSVVPYTEREKEEFANNVFDSFWRRCCQESRWDWLFEEPQISTGSPQTWQIPKSDPRLRHFRRFKGPRGDAHGGLTLADGDLLKELESLKESLSRQDLAAKLFIDAVFKSGNHELAQNLTKMDKERKRRQVHTEMLCVRQVRLLVEGSPSRYTEQQVLVERMSAKRVGVRHRPSSGVAGRHGDFLFANDSPSKLANNSNRMSLGVKRHANGSRNKSAIGRRRPGHRGSPDKSMAPFNPNELKKWKGEPEILDEWGRFQKYQARKKQSQMHLQGLNTFGVDPNAGLDPEEIAEREYELNQRLWAEFQRELEYLQEEAEIDERAKADKEAQAKMQVATAAAVKAQADIDERVKSLDSLNQNAYAACVAAGMIYPRPAFPPTLWERVINNGKVSNKTNGPRPPAPYYIGAYKALHKHNEALQRLSCSPMGTKRKRSRADESDKDGMPAAKKIRY